MKVPKTKQGFIRRKWLQLLARKFKWLDLVVFASEWYGENMESRKTQSISNAYTLVNNKTGERKNYLITIKGEEITDEELNKFKN